MKPGGLVEPGVTHYGRRSYTDAEAEKLYGKFFPKDSKGKKKLWSNMERYEKDAAKEKAKYNPVKKTPLQKAAKTQLDWVSNNAKKYSNPTLMEEKFLAHFKIKKIENAAIFKNAQNIRNDAGRILVSDAPNIKGYKLVSTVQAPAQYVSFVPGYSESNIFKLAILQNNKNAGKELEQTFKFIHNNFEKIRQKAKSDRITFEESLKLLNKRKGVLDKWGFKGIKEGLIKDALLEAGVSKEYMASFRLARTPLNIINDIIGSLSIPDQAKKWGLTEAQVLQTQEGWKNVRKGQRQANAWIDKLELSIGKNKFKNLFGNVVFEHQLAKVYGKNWNFLPRDYLLRGQMGNKAFNDMKTHAFDTPMMAKIKAYKKAVETKNTAKMLTLKGEINNLYTAFNNITEGYMKEYTPTFKDGKFEGTSSGDKAFAKARTHRYDKPNLGGIEMREMSLGMNKLSEAAKQIDSGGKQIFSEKQLGHFKKYIGKQEELRKYIKALPYEEAVKIAKEVNCPIRGKNAEGGRIGFGEGSGSMLACIEAKFNNNPKTFFEKTGNVASKGLDKIWKYSSPYWFPLVVALTGRLEAFKHPTKPEMWWETWLASDAVKRWGLDKVKLSQLKNASLAQKADILGKLGLSGGAWGSKILTKAAKVARPLVLFTELSEGYKADRRKENIVAQVAKRKGWDVRETINMYRLGEVRNWDRATVFQKMFGKMPDMNLGAIPDLIKHPEYQKRVEYLKNYFKNESEYIKIKERGELRRRKHFINKDSEHYVPFPTSMPKKEEDVMKGSVIDKDDLATGGIASLLKW